MCLCGGQGCLESLAAPAAVVARAGEDAALAGKLGLRGRQLSARSDFAKIARLAAGGDARCLELIEESATYLAKALLSITNLLDLDQIILAGPGFSEAGDIYACVAAQEINRLSYVRAMRPTRVELSKLGPSAAALGRRLPGTPQQLTPTKRTSLTRGVPASARVVLACRSRGRTWVTQ